MNNLTIECNGQCLENVVLVDINGGIKFEDFWSMTYDEMKSNDMLPDFVDGIMDATDKYFDRMDQAVATLIGEDGNFIWSILIETDNDNLRYVLVDWKKDGKNYRYES